MSAGVGKTYSMLEEAQKIAKEGIDVVVGIVNTHGRVETANLLTGLKTVPLKWIHYKNTVFEEFDIDEILRLKPQIVLIDELAHTNVPGSKHPKRWQDVLEILDAGISVFSTLNVQHIESLKEVIERITGIEIRETVPDLILDRASSIALVDIPPSELLQRLKEGRVYLGEQSIIAAQNFFKEDRLTALREMALRFTAEKVDHDLHGMLAKGLSKDWRARERLLVAVGPSPHSQELLRAARRLAFELDAPWIAVHVDTGITLNDADQLRLTNNLNLARDLGAEVITTADTDIVSALQKISHHRNVSQILIGRPSTHPIWDLFKENIVDRLVKESTYADIIIVRQFGAPYVYKKAQHGFHFTSSLLAYGLTFGLGVVMLSLGYLLASVVGYHAIGLGFLFSILLLSLFVGRGPIILASILSAFSWYLLFILPVKEIHAEDLSMLLIYLATGFIIGSLKSQIKEKEKLLKVSEEKSIILYQIEKEIATAPTFEHMKNTVIANLQKVFSGQFDILISRENNNLIFDSHLPILKDEKEQAVAHWAFEHNKIAGWSTDTLPSAAGLYFPIARLKGTLGVLAYYPKSQRSLSLIDVNFVQTVLQQVSIVLQKISDEELIKKTEFTFHMEKMHDAIFEAFSHIFQVPLVKIVRVSKILQSESIDPNTRMKSIKQIEKSSKSLQKVVSNIVSMSKLSSGYTRFYKKNHDINQLIQACLDEVKDAAEAHVIKLTVPSDLPPVLFDQMFMQQALSNLLFNAVDYSAPNTTVSLEVSVEHNMMKISVIDEGPGIPFKTMPFVFEKFYQVYVPASHSSGIGLGLPVAKAIIELHGGKIELKNREQGGLEASILLPLSSKNG
jgi:two-component system, OmpR family, sensor histidine kinase KdpD